MLENITHIISLLAIFQLGFVAFFLLTQSQGKRVGNYLLAGFFLALAFSIADGYLLIVGWYERHPAWAFIGNNFGFLYGPLLYFYVRSVVYQRSLPWHFPLHLIPFFASCILSILSYHQQSPEMKQYILTHQSELDFPPLVYIITVLGYALLFAYLLLAFRSVRHYRNTTQARYSALEIINVRWLQSMLYTFSGVILLSLISNLITLLAKVPLYSFALLLVIIAVFWFISQILMKALQYPGILIGLPSEKEPPAKYAASPLTEQEQREHADRLQTWMDTEKPYLDASLTIDQLAQQVGIPTRHLSQVINGVLGQSFFDFVNRYRIEEARQLLSHPPDPKMTVLEVMYQSGFNSKSSFNTLFKQKTKLTPTEYRRKHAG